MLRASAEAEGHSVDLRGIVDAGVAIGVPAAGILVAFADAVIGNDEHRLAEAREAVLAELGAAGLLGAASIAANFCRNDRIANAIGIPLERDFVTQSEDFRAALGINNFPSARNTLG